MVFKVGDGVQTAEGLKGEIILVTNDGRHAYVHIVDEAPGAHATLRPLDTLKKIGDVE